MIAPLTYVYKDLVSALISISKRNPASAGAVEVVGSHVGITTIRILLARQHYKFSHYGGCVFACAVGDPRCVQGINYTYTF